MSDLNEPPSEWLQQLRNLTQEEALALLQTTAIAYPEDPRPHLLLGGRYAEAKNLDLAEAAYICALQRAPDFSIARFQLGLLQLTTARPSVAIATWAPLDDLSPNDPLRLFKQGLIYMVQDSFTEALRFLREGQLQNTTNPPLNGDMQRLIDILHPLADGQAVVPTSAKITEVDGDGQEPQPPSPNGPGHFLLSAYRNQQ